MSYDEIINISEKSIERMILKQMFPKLIYEDEPILLNTDESSKIFLITSIIYTSSNPLFGNTIRSIFTGEERLVQTIETLKTVREKVPDAYIIFAEGSSLNPEDISKLYQYIDLIILFSESETAKYHCNSSENKSIGEVYLLSTIISRIEKFPFNYLIKLSGRYYLNDNFNLNNLLKKSISGQVIDDECVLTVCYSVHKDTINDFKENLFTFIRTDCQINDIEHHIYSSGIKIHHIETIGVSGKPAWSGELLEW